MTGQRKTCRLSGAVMGHPSRINHAKAVAQRIDSDRVELVMDPQPDGPRSALRTTVRAWSSVPSDATHHLVLHDDMVPCTGFWAEATRAIQSFPEAALALCAFWNSRNGAAVRLAAMTGHRWVRGMREYTPCIALILPAEAARGYANFATTAGDCWPEDVLMYRYLDSIGLPTLVATPSLAEHQDLRSLSGNDFHGVRRSSWFLADPQQLPPSWQSEPAEFHVVPFFKHGVAQCAVRLGTRGEHWENIRTERYLARAGHRLDEIEARMESLCPGVPRTTATAAAAIRGTWLTAYAMGAVCASDPATGSRQPDDDVSLRQLCEAALSTIAPGGVCDRALPQDVDALQRDLTATAAVGLAEGRLAASRIAGEAKRAQGARGPGAGTGRRTQRPADGVLLLMGAGRYPASQIARALADRGHHVVARHSASPDDRYLDLSHVTGTELDEVRASAVVDLTHAPGEAPALAAPPRPFVAGPPGTERRLGVEYPCAVCGQPRSSSGCEEDLEGRETTLHVGDLYGPGMPLAGPLAVFVTQALMRQPIVITSDPLRTVRPLHVDDLAAYIDRSLVDDRPGGSVSVAGGECLTVRELAQLVTRIVRPVSIVETQTARTCDCAESRDAPPQPYPDWRPGVDLEWGIRSLAQWIAYEGDPPLTAADLSHLSDI